MRWEDMAGSSNVEDRRGQAPRRGGGGGMGFPIRGASSLFIVVLVLIAGYYGIDLSPVLMGDGTTISAPTDYEATPQDEEMAQFSSVALKSTEDTWSTIFNQENKAYTPPKMVLYTGVTETACGYGQAAMGPFYCPFDETVYLDTVFFKDMQDRMGGGGDFAQGYVIAHEVGHHIQHLMGIDTQIRSLQQRLPKSQANQLSIRMELQADCYAGVWGKKLQQ